MSSSRIPSPARSQGAPVTPRRYKSRGTRSVGSPARSTASGRLSSIVDDFKKNNRDSFALSPLTKTILSDNTEIEMPKRRSWWRKVENSREMIQVPEMGNAVNPNLLDELDVEVLSQEKKNYTLDIPDSSDSESISSIIVPQRRLFTQKENVPQMKFGQVIGNRESTSKQSKTTLEDKSMHVAPKNLFGHTALKSDFPAALLAISPDKTLANKTKEMPEIKNQPRNLFGNRGNDKRKNMFADFVLSESEDEIPEIQPRVFTFQKQPVLYRRSSAASRGVRDSSPTSSITTDIDMEDWKLLPSSTMVEHQLEANMTPLKKGRLSKLSEAKESINTNSTKQSDKSINKLSKNKSLNNSKKEQQNKSNNKSKSRINNEDQTGLEKQNMSKDKNESSSKVKNSSQPQGTTTYVVNENTQNKIDASKSTNVTQMQGVTYVVDAKDSGNLKNKTEILNKTQTQTHIHEIELKEAENEGKSKNKDEADDDDEIHLTYEDNEIEENNLKETKTENTETVHHQSKISQANSIQFDEQEIQQENVTLQPLDEECINVSQEKSGIEHNDSEQENYKIQLPENTIVNKSLDNKCNSHIVEHKENEKQEEEFNESQEARSDTEYKVDKIQASEELKSNEQSETELQNEAENKIQDQDEGINESDQNDEQDGDHEIASEVEQEDGGLVDSEVQENDDQEEKEPEHHDEEIEVEEQEEDPDEEEHEVEAEEEDNDEEVEAENLEEHDAEAEEDNEEVEAESLEEHEVEAEEDNEEVEAENLEEHEVEAEEDNEEVEAENLEEHEVEAEEDNEEVEAENLEEHEVEAEEDNEEVEAENLEEHEVEAEEDNEEVEAENLEEHDVEAEEEDINQEVETEDHDHDMETEEQDDFEVEEQEDVEIQASKEIEDQEIADAAQSETEVENESENESIQEYEEPDEGEEEEVKEGIEIDEEAYVDNQEEEDNEQNESKQIEHEDVISDSYQEHQQTEQSKNHEVHDTHDTTGRYRKKPSTNVENSPEAILHEIDTEIDSFTAKGRNTSIRKTILKDFTIKPSLAPPRDSTGFSDGTKNSSAEGSGWDSHRTTRKTLRQTFGKDFTPRKSLRALVMEKSAKRQTIINEANLKLHQANSTELPDDNEMEYDENVDPVESDHEVSRIRRQTTLEMYLQKTKKENMERKQQIEEQVKNSFKSAPLRDVLLNFKPPSKLAIRKANKNPTQIASKAKKRAKPTFIDLEDLPPELVEDMKYRPPKRFRPNNASWITKRLYKFLETKLEPKYDYKARVRAEKLIQTLYIFVRETRRDRVAPTQLVSDLKKEMARLDIVKTHFDFYNFFRDYLPLEVKAKVVPDIVNGIQVPREGVFSPITIT